MNILEPRSVWVVTSGEYSDYQVDGVFEREDDASAAVELGFGDYAQEFPFYPAGVLPEKVVVWLCSAWLHDDGTATQEESCPHNDWDAATATRLRRPVVRDEYVTYAKQRYIVAEALTREAAVKACADRLAKRRAEQLEPGAGPEVSG